MKKILLWLALACFLVGCSGATLPGGSQTVYEATFLTLFDTVTTVKGAAPSKEAFEETATQVHDQLEHYHRLFDIYNTYEGMENLKTVNDQAGIAPVKVDDAIIALLKDCLEYYTLTDGRTNVMLGSVLQIWHEYRTEGLHDPENARLPDPEKLQNAALHTDIASLVIDEAASTVYISDPEARLDVGAVAKGWATQKVAQALPSGILLSVGGNVCATGPKQPGQSWVIGVQDPKGDQNDFLHTLYVDNVSVVTSGDYQRGYTVDGKIYHHIIDPDTQMPSAYWRSVTVITQNSALADALSTALFLLPLEEGKAMAQCCGAQALWVDASGAEFMTAGFQDRLRT